MTLDFFSTSCPLLWNCLLFDPGLPLSPPPSVPLPILSSLAQDEIQLEPNSRTLTGSCMLETSSLCVGRVLHLTQPFLTCSQEKLK